MSKINILPNCVLLFHRIPSENWFYNLLNYLNKFYFFVSLEELNNYYYERKKYKSFVHITFDDGDRSVYNYAFPVLKKLKIPSTLFISPKVIIEECNYWFQNARNIEDFEVKNIISKNKRINAKEINNYSKIALLKSLSYFEITEIINKSIKENSYSNQNINFSQLVEMHKSGLIEIGAHTLNHPILKNESDQTVETEIINSISILSDKLNKKIISFAYPNGIYGLDFNYREINIVKNSGIKLAFASDSGHTSNKQNPYRIPRIGISKGNFKMIILKLIFPKLWYYSKIIFKYKVNEEVQRFKLKKGNLL